VQLVRPVHFLRVIAVVDNLLLSPLCCLNLAMRGR
jgi:hypothetical protein